MEDENEPNSGLEELVSTNETGEETSSPALREDMIQNAVGFLSNPQVKSAPEADKRKFLTNKGVTEAEIDEAVARVEAAPAISLPPSRPPPPRPVARQSTVPVPSFQGSSNAPPVTQALEPARQGVPWTQMVLVVGAVGAGSWLARGAVKPLLKKVYTTLYPDDFKQEVPKVESAEQVLERQQSSKFLEATKEALESQTKELKNTTEAIHAMVKAFQEHSSVAQETLRTTTSSSIMELREELQVLSAKLDQPADNAKQSITVDNQMHTQLLEIRSLLSKTLSDGEDNKMLAPTPCGGLKTTPSWAKTPPATPEPELQLPLLSPPAGQQQVADFAKAQVAEVTPEQVAGQGEQGERVRGPGGQAPEDMPPHPRSYAEVLEMLEQGKTPPGIREIDDKPPNPHQEFPSSRMQPRPKPWERKSDASSFGKPGGSVPPWTLGKNGIPNSTESSFATQQSVTGSSVIIRDIGSEFDSNPNQSTEWTPPPKPSFPGSVHTKSNGKEKETTPGGSKMQSSSTKITHTPGRKFARDSSSEED